ncbi:bifunctional aminoglycoside phosphotransferase/ATP-binding protein [Mycolicibacterium neworleansense]|uniref:Cytidylate kinase n=1 Tax=Mycolicibacterium neworleansense TaxID=146018 RepID=A0A0H5RS50_9MYCO|nr:AAA family ATPase [Mycolicibacterium neworleansense]MCV7361417.1 AAA family ATPase [Mycolicibacterium neworleansense]CRZ16768.1 Cytidylate kinase [Mycolicibacterium neworleansense]
MGTSAWPTRAAEIHETHTGIVALIGDRAYKVKKPVVTDFLDFSSVEQREQVCAREVQLNRRLAADSYLGVAHLSDPQGGPPEPVIVMRRYPDARRLTAIVVNGEPVVEHLSSVAERLARFHADAERSADIDAAGKVPAIAGRWHDNLAELRRHTGTVVSEESVAEVGRLADQFIHGRAALFADRIANGHIVDGHGDLLTGDIFCMADGPVILDCLEFDDNLRHVDCADDAAFLAMDLEFLGRTDLADHFIAEYQRFSGDVAPASLLDFLIAYRAVVRAKTDCIRVEQGIESAAADARRHLDIALDHLRKGTVRLIVVGGGPGTGKTTLARALAEQISAQVISTDDVRRELQEQGLVAGDVGILNQGLYSSENVAAVYDAVLQKAGSTLAEGRSVILDGTWRDPGLRRRARDIASEHGCPTTELACTTPIDEAKKRITQRQTTTSDATPEIAEGLAAGGAEWPDAHLINTRRPLADSVAEAQRICCSSI